jgi:pantoate--beta-alanine ligase
MKIITTTQEIREILTRLHGSHQTIGLVPTMGALHKGHLSLVEKSVAENHISVVSIFVNPTQFDNPDDLENYPQTLENDLKLLKNTGCDYVFAPKSDEIYDQQIVSENFSFDGLEHEMEGKYRQNHFNGVGTVVSKLFDITQPTKAYFGEKDFQQLQIIKKLVKIKGLNVEIVGCKICREHDGLAMSSRNLRLSDEHRKAAPFLYQTLKEVQQKSTANSFLELHDWVKNKFKNQPLLELEYFEIAEEKSLQTATEKKENESYRAFIAVFAGPIRLIDNIALHP